MNKFTPKKVLFCGDRSTAKTGFGRYKRDLMNKAMKVPGLEIAEFAHGGTELDKNTVPWKFYPMAPSPNNPGERAEFNQDPENVYGKWRWEKCLLHFRPDIVITPLDPWQMRCEAESTLRPFYHLISSPTVDSEPQKQIYLEIFKRADTLVTYTEYGKMVLEGEGIKVQDVIPMGVDPTVFFPVHNKEMHKISMGLPKDSVVVGFVARNNPRKRIPELIKWFSQTPSNYCLYLHTTHPDRCWNINEFVMGSDIKNRIYFSYECKKTGKVFPSVFRDRFTTSPFGGVGEIVNPIGTDLSDEELNKVYNCFDLYIQFSQNEGFGVPIIEAAACDVPVIAPGYGAMGEVASKVGGYLFNYDSEILDNKTHAYYAVLNGDVFENLAKFIKPGKYREKCLKHYSLDVFTSKWIELINSLDIKSKWDYPYRQNHEINISNNCSHSELVSYTSSIFPGSWSLEQLKEIRDLNHNLKVNGLSQMTYPKQMYMHQIAEKKKKMNEYEMIRVGLKLLEEESWMK